MAKQVSLKRLELSNFKLSTLLKITKSINNNLPVDELLEQFKIILDKDLNIGKILLFSYNHKWECIVNVGIDKKISDNINIENDLLNYKKITNLAVTLDSVLKYFDVIIPVFHHEVPIAYVLIGDIDEEQAGMSPTIKHLHFIQTLTNIIVVAIENKRLFEENLKQEALKRELELASKMQNMLIPNPAMLPNNQHVQVAAYYLPHYEIGGDYYDFLSLNSNEYGFCIADVSGKGISAALLMSNFQANIRALFSANHLLKNTVIKLNDKVMESVKGEKFITLFVGKYNVETKILTYINAGHNPPILLNKETNSIEHLKLGCVGVGMLEEIPTIAVGKVKLKKGSRLICYTDGVDELENEKNEAFDMKIVENILKNNGDMNSVVDDIVSKLHVHKGENDFFDDVSIMGIEFY